VINNTSGEVASPLRCLVRNLFCILWPVELIMVLVNPTRRIGDYVAGTAVMRYQKDLSPSRRNNIGQLLLAFVIAYGVIFLFTMPVQLLNRLAARHEYVESSFNVLESIALEKAIADGMVEVDHCDARVYDSVKGRQLKYIRVAVDLNDDFADEGKQSASLTGHLRHIIYSRYARETFIGNATFRYSAPGVMHKLTISIGTN
jgi:hypothetical protein